jgi:hypothetical protein
MRTLGRCAVRTASVPLRKVEASTYRVDLNGVTCASTMCGLLQGLLVSRRTALPEGRCSCPRRTPRGLNSGAAHGAVRKPDVSPRTGFQRAYPSSSSLRLSGSRMPPAHPHARPQVQETGKRAAIKRRSKDVAGRAESLLKSGASLFLGSGAGAGPSYPRLLFTVRRLLAQLPSTWQTRRGGGLRARHLCLLVCP